MFLTINAQGGLANRMRSIASAVSLAKDINRELRIIWQPTKEMAAHFYDLFEESESLPSVESMSNLRYHLTTEIPRKRNFYLSYLYQSTRYARCLNDVNGQLVSRLDNPIALKETVEGLKGNVLITSGLDFYNTNSIDYNHLFRPKKEVASIIEQITASFDKNTYGIHIRRTDNKESILNSPTSLFEDYIQNTIIRNGKARFFIASDDSDEKKNLKTKFGERVIVTEFPLTRDTVEGTIYALSEMYALATTRSIAGSYWSSFSEIAARIGNIPFQALSKTPSHKKS